MCQQRKGVLRERMHLKLALEGVVDHARHILTNKGVLQPHIKDGPKVTEDLVITPSVQNTQPPAPPTTGDAVSDMLASLQLTDPMAGFTQKSPSKKKITKADFANSTGDLTSKRNENSDDPLSQLDPL